MISLTNVYWYLLHMKSLKIKPKYNKHIAPKIALIALTSDLMIEKDFNSVLKNKSINLFVNRIESYNPLNKKNLIKMSKILLK